MPKTILALMTLALVAGCDDPADDVPAAEVVETDTVEAPEPEATDEAEAAGEDDVAPPPEAAVAAPQPPGALPIDTGRSTFEFVGSKVTGAETGHFGEWGGYIVLQDPIEQSRVSVTIQMATVTTEIARLTSHLRTDDFFDVATHPRALFETVSLADAPDGAGEATHLVTGRLTLRGTTQTITFPINLEVTEQEVRARAEFSIDRQRWGINYRGMEDDLIRDQVVIRFDVRASRDSG